MVAYYEPEDVESLAEAVYAAALHPARQTGQARAARGFLADYGWERQGEELVQMYRSPSGELIE